VTAIEPGGIQACVVAVMLVGGIVALSMQLLATSRVG
jgi:hypothetical protein